MNMNKTLLLSGDFARLCGINKSTLHYYVSIGLIQPILVTESNYKYYSTDQSYTIQLISILQKSGCSLSEIRSYLNGNSNTEQFCSMLEEQELKLIQQRNELNHTITMLKTVRYFMDFTINSEFSSPREFYLPHTLGILCTPFPKPTQPDDAEYAITFNKHMQMCESYSHAVKYPIGRIMKERSFLMEDYSYSSLFCFTSSAFETNNSLAKGNYICCTSNGNNTPEVYHSMLHYISEKGLTITGSATELSISIPHTQPEHPDYTILVFIPVA